MRGETPRSSSLEAGRGRTNDDCYPIERQERMGDDTQTTPRELEGEGRRRPAQDEKRVCAGSEDVERPYVVNPGRWIVQNTSASHA